MSADSVLLGAHRLTVDAQEPGAGGAQAAAQPRSCRIPFCGANLLIRSIDRLWRLPVAPPRSRVAPFAELAQQSERVGQQGAHGPEHPGLGPRCQFSEATRQIIFYPVRAEYPDVGLTWVFGPSPQVAIVVLGTQLTVMRCHASGTIPHQRSRR